MEISGYILVGLVMGIAGGLLGIGGSIVMIPAMVVIFKKDQHLAQASAMICNFFVATSSALIHKKAKSLSLDVLKWLVPASALAVLGGVALSNCEFFAEANSRNLTRLFGVFLIYPLCSNLWRLFGPADRAHEMPPTCPRRIGVLSSFIGTVTGLLSGLLGIGGGTITVPLQQLLLKNDLKNAISNSAATMIVMALFGAVYKNATLYEHGIALSDSLKIAVSVFPAASLGAVFGAKLMHVLPKRCVRAAFVILLTIVSYRLIVF